MMFAFFHPYKILILIFALQNFINTKPKGKKSNSTKSVTNKLPDEILKVFNSTKQECINEILLIYQSDYKEQVTNPYSLLELQSKSLNKTMNQVTKKLSKYAFYEQKNFTGIRWTDPKLLNVNGEVKKMVQGYLQQISEHFESKYFNCKGNLPEFIVENYQNFFKKINEIKKMFSKFELF